MVLPADMVAAAYHACLDAAYAPAFDPYDYDFKDRVARAFARKERAEKRERCWVERAARPRPQLAPARRSCAPRRTAYVVRHRSRQVRLYGGGRT
jgi:hypothetical protein